MPPYKAPSFQDRQALAAQARQKALDAFKSRPQPDEAELAERRRVAVEREAALAEERAAKAAARAAEKAEREAAKAAAAAEAAERKAARLKPSTPEEMKAARDARYAARKARK